MADDALIAELLQRYARPEPQSDSSPLADLLMGGGYGTEHVKANMPEPSWHDRYVKPLGSAALAKQEPNWFGKNVLGNPTLLPALTAAMFITGMPAMRNLAAAGRPAPLNFTEVAENMRLHGYKPQDIWNASVAYFKKHDPRFVGAFEGEPLLSGERPWTVEAEPPTLKPTGKTTATLGEHYDAPEFFAAHPSSEKYTSVRREKKDFDYSTGEPRGALWEMLVPYGVQGRWNPKTNTMQNFGNPRPEAEIGTRAQHIADHEFTHANSPYVADAGQMAGAKTAKDTTWDEVMRLRKLGKDDEARAYASEMRSTWPREDRERIPAFETVREDYGPPDMLDWIKAATWGVPAALLAAPLMTAPLAYMDARDKRRTLEAQRLKALDEHRAERLPPYPPPPPLFGDYIADDYGMRHITLESPQR